MNVTRAVAIMVVLTLLALVAAWQQVSIVREGYAIARLRREKAGLQARRQRVLCEIAALSAPEAIAQRLEKFNVELTRPQGLEALDGSSRLEMSPEPEGVKVAVKRDGSPESRRRGANTLNAH